MSRLGIQEKREPNQETVFVNLRSEQTDFPLLMTYDSAKFSLLQASTKELSKFKNSPAAEDTKKMTSPRNSHFS